MKNLLKAKLAHVKVIILALVAITAILIAGIYSWFQKNPEGSFIPQFPLEKKIGIKQLPANQLPFFFPPKIPLEKDSLILQNYSQIVGNKEQSTRQFISQKSLEENFELYKKYLIDDKWEIISLIEGAEIKSLLAKKTQNTLNITISHNKQTNQVIVDITLVGPKLINKVND